MEFLLTSHTELLLNCEKTQLCMGHIVILSFLLFLWSVRKYKTCNWHGLISYIYFLTWSEYFFLSFFLFSFQFSFCFLVSNLCVCTDLTKLTWPYWQFKIILAQITLFFNGQKRRRGRPLWLTLLGVIIEAPSLENVGLSYNYYGRGITTNLTLAPRKS